MKVRVYSCFGESKFLRFPAVPPPTKDHAKAKAIPVPVALQMRLWRCVIYISPDPDDAFVIHPLATQLTELLIPTTG